MRHLIPILTMSVLAFAGCAGSRTQINPGAELAIYVGSTQYMFDKMPAGLIKMHHVNEGFYDPTDGSITINEQLRGWGFTTKLMHEMNLHAYDHQRVSIMELMQRYESPSFSFNFHDPESVERGRAYLATFPDPLAVKRALEAAAKATEEAR